MITLTYFPHGTTVDNEAHRSSGWNDVELSAKGVQQSVDLPSKLSNRQFDIVFCSDFRRAIDSAQLAFGKRYPIVQDARLRECNYGTYNGQDSAIVEPLQEQHTTTSFPEGESYEDVKRRMAAFLDELKVRYEGKSIIVIAHKATQLALEVLTNGKTWEQAFAEDWRKTGAWQPGWVYMIS
jgi:broad specificity phosphatase PhoE